MAEIEKIIDRLRAYADASQLEGMARYGMAVDNRLGIKIPVLRKLAKETGKNHALAQGLWDTGIAEARILASMIDRPEEVTESQMERWVADFDSWDVCDQVCMNLFDKTPLAWEMVPKWAQREEEFVKRAAFALIACLAWHDKKAEDEKFISFIPVIKEGARDGRNYVKKGVSWALRHIGKRSLRLNKIAVQTAEDIGQADDKTMRWVASDVLKDITRPEIIQKLQAKE